MLPSKNSCGGGTRSKYKGKDQASYCEIGEHFMVMWKARGTEETREVDGRGTDRRLNT